MLRNYLAAALRNLARNKLYAAINIIGLAVGLAAAILIAAYVRHEYSFNQWIEGHDRTFLATQVINFAGAPKMTVNSTRPALKANLQASVPGLAIARLQPDTRPVRHANMEAREDLYWTDANFFEVFPLPMIAGNREKALATAGSVVITRDIAVKYFDRPDPIGQTIELGNARYPMRVTAVLENLPTNTHFGANIQILASGKTAFSTLARDDREVTNSDNLYTYIRLSSGTTLGNLTALMPDLARRELAERAKSFAGALPLLSSDEPTSIWHLEFVPLADIHLRPAQLGSSWTSGDASVLQAIVGVGVLIILIAGVNFVNLTTARALRRSVEVGIRKTSGASRGDLICQFLGETFLYTAVATVLAIALVELSLPYLEAYVNADLSFDYLLRPELALEVVVVICALSILAGAYPAFVQSLFRPATALKASHDLGRNPARVRAILVGLQFAVLIGIVIATMTIYRQKQFALNDGLRVNKDQVLVVQEACNENIRNQIASIPGVRSAACNGATILGSLRASSTIQIAGSSVRAARQSHVDFEFFGVYGLTPIAGRFFSRNRVGDAVPDTQSSYQPPIVINESAVRLLGFGSPDNAVGKEISWTRIVDSTAGRSSPMTPSMIIGVVRDFSFLSVREEIEPQIYYVDPTFFAAASVKLEGNRIGEAIVAIDALFVQRNGRPPRRAFLDEFMERQYRDVVRQGTTFAIFAGLALAIACLGLFGLATYNGERRTKEIGIRKATGASTTAILGLLSWEFAKPVLWANLVAWPVAYYVMSRWLSGFAYHTNLEFWVFLAAGALALLIALATVFTHTLVVARAKPIQALRYE